MDCNQTMNPLDYSEILLLAHPVGSLYWSMEATDPAELFGGTWERIKDQFILAAGDTYKAGTSGGAASAATGGSSAANTGGTAITVEQMPAHAHSLYGWAAGFSYDGGAITAIAQDSYDHGVTTRETGSGQPHTHAMAHTHTVATMPPYTVAYCWKRTA